MSVSVEKKTSIPGSQVGCFNSSLWLEYGNNVPSQGPIAHQTIEPIQWNRLGVSDFLRITVVELEPKSKLEYLSF